MKKKTPPKDDKPEVQVGGAPVEPEKPKKVNDDKLSFCFNDLQFDDYFIVDNGRFVRFFVDVEDPYLINFKYGDYIEMQLAIWEAKHALLKTAKEGEELCVCDRITPDFELLSETETVYIPLLDPDTKEIVGEIEETLPIYVAFNMINNFTVGGICKTKKKK